MMSDKQGFKGDLKQGIFKAKNENLKALEALFPSAVKDGQLDVEALKEELGQFEEVGAEKYGLTWSGKQNAKKIALEDSIGRTLKFVPEESVNPDTTENLYIEGDNLEVLKLLRQNYYGAIKMVYIDPPYNTDGDFIYNDKFKMGVETSDIAEGIRDEYGTPLQKNSKSSNRYHANWLNMMYPRLKVVKDFLTDDGVVLISIDDNEVHNLREICDEIFGYSNFICQFVWKSRAKPTNAGNARFRPQKTAEYVVAYAKSSPESQIYNVVSTKERTYPHSDENGKYRTTTILTSNRGTFRRETMRFSSNGFTPDEDYRWKAGKNIIDRLFDTGHIYINDDGIPLEKKYQHEETDPLYPIYCFMDPDLSGTAENGKADLNQLIGKRHGFDTIKPVQLLKYLIQTFSNEDDMILDIFSGSSTTAQAVLELNLERNENRKYIMIQFPELIMDRSEYDTICQIGKERIRHAGNRVKEEVETSNAQLKVGDTPNVLPDIGFKVFETADTMIRWNYEDIQLQRAYLEEVATTSEVLEGQALVGANMMSHKDQLDFMPYATDIDVVYEILLRQRDIPLSASIRLLDEIDKRTYLFDESFLVCLETEITTELIEKITAIRPLPIKFIFRDSAFEDDINLKDETIRLFKALVTRNTNEKQSAYTVEFI